jgi:hypothetical protein
MHLLSQNLYLFFLPGLWQRALFPTGGRFHTLLRYSRKVGVITNNVEDYRSVEILSEIPKRFELLVYRGMYSDLKNLMYVYQSTWLHEEPIDDNEPIEVCIFRAEFN